MASNRTLIYFFSCSLLLMSCAGSKEVESASTPTTSTSETKISKREEKKELPQEKPLDFDVDKFRTSLSDPASTKDNSLPESFKAEEIVEGNLPDDSNIGFRIQLISTSDRAKAQKMVADFNDWLFSNDAINYKAESYIIFKQPNYRVHVGDFKSRIQANEFIKTVKRRFSDAWIIQDTIIEDRSPDSVTNN